MSNPQVIIFVEDPGAANYAIPLARSFSDSGVPAALFAERDAAAYLKDRGQSFVDSKGLAHLENFSGNLRCFLFGNSDLADSRAFALMDEAKKMGIPTFSFVDGLGNFANRFRGSTEQPFFHKPDFLLLPDNKSAEWATILGYPQKQIIVVGHPYYDWILERRAEVTRAPETPPKTIGFFTEPLGGNKPEQFQRSDEYTLDGWGNSEGRNQVVIEELLSAIGPWRDQVRLILRLHPKNHSDDFSEHRKYFDEISQGGDTLKVISDCDLLVGQTSIALLESALLGRPTLSIVPRALERDWLSSIGWGMTPSVFTRADLERQVREFMTGVAKVPPPPEEAIGLGASEKIVAAVKMAIEKRS